MTIDEPEMHRVYRTINWPLRICGIERRLFLLAIGLGGGVFNLFHTLLGGVLMFAVLYAVGVWATRRDSDFLRIVLSSRGTRRRFDVVRYVGDRGVVTFRAMRRPAVVRD
jgi:hypothetical protein